jgi:hypothetical protein
MCQIVPILGENLNSVISNVIPLVAQNLASKNSEIQDMAENILDVFVDYLGAFKIMLLLNIKYMLFCVLLFSIIDGGVLLQPFSNIAQHGNVRIRPQIINKLSGIKILLY